MNKTNIDVELRGITRDEIDGEGGVRVTHQFINFHVLYDIIEQIFHFII